MQGSPLFRLLLILGCWLLLAIPVYRLTSHRLPQGSDAGIARRAAAASSVGQKCTLKLQVLASGVPTELTVEVPGQSLGAKMESNVLDLHPHSVQITQDVDLVYPAEGLDLIVHASWPTQVSTSSVSTSPASVSKTSQPPPNLNAAPIPHALRLRVIKEQQLIFETTLWGTQTLTEAIALPSLQNLPRLQSQAGHPLL